MVCRLKDAFDILVTLETEPFHSRFSPRQSLQRLFCELRELRYRTGVQVELPGRTAKSSMLIPDPFAPSVFPRASSLENEALLLIEQSVALICCSHSSI